MVARADDERDHITGQRREEERDGGPGGTSGGTEFAPTHGLPVPPRRREEREGRGRERKSEMMRESEREMAMFEFEEENIDPVWWIGSEMRCHFPMWLWTSINPPHKANSKSHHSGTYGRVRQTRGRKHDHIRPTLATLPPRPIRRPTLDATRSLPQMAFRGAHNGIPHRLMRQPWKQVLKHDCRPGSATHKSLYPTATSADMKRRTYFSLVMPAKRPSDPPRALLNQLTRRPAHRPTRSSIDDAAAIF